MAAVLLRARSLFVVAALFGGYMFGSWRSIHHSGGPFDRTHSAKLPRLGAEDAAHSAVGTFAASSTGGRETADTDRNLAYWDSAVATASEIRAMVKQDLEREYGLAQQTEMLTRLIKAVREMQGRRQHDWAARLRTTSAPTPHKKPICVNNPPMHFERTGDMIKECTTFKRNTEEEPDGWQPTHAIIITLKSASDPEIRARVDFLGKQGIAATSFPATDGAKAFASDYSAVMNLDTGRSELAFTDSRILKAPTLRRGAPAYLTPGERGYVVSAKQPSAHFCLTLSPSASVCRFSLDCTPCWFGHTAVLHYCPPSLARNSVGGLLLWWQWWW
jgi:hypothetical protein